MSNEKRERQETPDEDDTLQPEYDFSGGRRGATAVRYAQGTNIVVIDSDVLDVFPDSEAVNEALRALAPVFRNRQNAAS